MSFSMPGLLNWLMAAAPYSGQTRSGDGGNESGGGDGPPRMAMDIRRIMETLLPAAVVGIIVMWGSVQTLGTQITTCKERMNRIEMMLDRIHGDIYGPRWHVPGEDGYEQPGVWDYIGPPKHRPDGFWI